MNEKPIVLYPVVVEGKYDKIKLDSVIDARIIITEGFGVFSNEEKKRLFIKLAVATKLIIATDSDGAGLVIRNYFKSIIPKDRLIHIFIPSIKGKEKRKTEPSREGTLGLEGMSGETLRTLFLPYTGCGCEKKPCITKGDLFSWGLSGTKDSSEKRKRLCEMLSLPTVISSNMLLDVLNLLYSKEETREFIGKL